MPTGSQKLAVLLCKFSDTEDIDPQPVDYFTDLFVKRGTGGLNDYWADASLGSINLDGTEVFGWKTSEQNKNDYLSNKPDRWSKIQGAIDFFGIDASKFDGVVALYNVSVGDGGRSHGGVLGGPDDYNVTFLGHETGHLFGLAHSYDQSTRKRATWSAPGEYWDKYDIMSAMNVFHFDHPRFQQSGPLLCAPNLDRMGWLPRSRVWTEDVHGSFSECVDLVPLGHPEIPGYLAAQIGSLWIELRVPDRWDAGLPSRASVLIHTMMGSNAKIMASDKTHWTEDWQAGQIFGPPPLEMAIAGGTRVEIASIDSANMRARVCITHQAGRDDKEGVVFVGSYAIGDGWILLKDVLFRIPPKGGPLRELLDGAVQAGINQTRSDIVTGGLSADDVQAIASLMRATGSKTN
ncbi:hypothetical protein GUK30_10190 [Rhizobium leguminosarum]|uniref:hypothetical protein n=1 Tax=Rhizobium ruizarguesonis TaxID=2081791 RepID=UPI0013BF98FB|nr:hypothetical protein [Rhizobium ruizarguesonis]NEI19782.1 hypothetical protein [Rhizobium ruizarguesonis]